MAPATYDQVLAQNIRAARARAGLGQESLAARMRALGFEGWVRQTVGSTEKPTRRVTAEEIFGLALALETSMSGLMAPTVIDAPPVELPGGSVGATSVVRLATGFNDGSVKWDGDVPVFGPGQAAWFGGPPGAGRTVDEVLRDAAAEDEG
jgi:transcriptional regulator with XRE-family HTH domain